MRRDLCIVAILDAVLAVATLAYFWLIHHIWTGMASLAPTVLLALVGLVCTAIAGAMIRRLIVGVVGIAFFWMVASAGDVATSDADLGNVAMSVAILAIPQISTLLGAWCIFHGPTLASRRPPQS
jgi:hypothetical protein